MFKIKLTLVMIIAALGTAMSVFAAQSPNDTQGTFISYSSPNDVTTLADYANQKKLGGYIVWSIDGDTDPVTSADTSLLATLKSHKNGQEVMAYFGDWVVL